MTISLKAIVAVLIVGLLGVFLPAAQPANATPVTPSPIGTPIGTPIGGGDICDGTDPTSGALLDEDTVKLLSTEIDFGVSPDFNWEPTAGGSLDWREDQGCKIAQLSGFLLTDNVYPNCARIEIRQYYDSDFSDSSYGTWLGSVYSEQLCPSDYGVSLKFIELDTEVSNQLNRVWVQLEVGTNNSGFTNVGTGKGRILG